MIPAVDVAPLGGIGLVVLIIIILLLLGYV